MIKFAVRRTDVRLHALHGDGIAVSISSSMRILTRVTFEASP